jgi:hypothetical protein
MNEYWKDPRLGTDDDEGAYDYYACDKPDNKQYMCWSTCKCDDCRKETRFKRYGKAWNAYWYCYDGWDGDSGFTCWRCLLKAIIWSWKRKRKEKREKKKTFKSFTKNLKMKNVRLTREQKKHIKEVMR